MMNAMWDEIRKIRDEGGTKAEELKEKVEKAADDYATLVASVGISTK